jgi:UDP-N-acetylmuramoyl-L-alanyl-D-glutamate--2,6-diaminopimelate ligase
MRDRWWERVPGSRLIGADEPVADLTHDSRLAGPGTAFIAVPGQSADGHDYLEGALAAGVRTVVVQADRQAAWSRLEGRANLVVVPDTRLAMGPLAAAVHGDPSRRLRIVGVTGTDGKTTTSWLTAHVLDRCGFKAGFLTSAGFDTGASLETNESHMTTIEATGLQAQLARAVAAGRETMVVEASSEGLAMHRLDACRVDVAVFTNLTRDHLDFHGTMERYLAAKGILFEKLAEPSEKAFRRVAIVNDDDPASAYLRGLVQTPVIGYGTGTDADLRVEDIEVTTTGLRFAVVAGATTLTASAPLVGRFNAMNCLAAIAVAQSQGAPLPQAIEALADFPGVPGRMEVVDCGQPFRVIIDIASTPAALENVLTALRGVTPGRLSVVFGAAGGRDPARRDGMGRVAGSLADRAIITNEDPRDEDPDAIIEAIATGLCEAGREEGRDFLKRPDRRAAIAEALSGASAGDTVLLAGKATETSMVFAGGRHVPWNERRVAEELLEA